MGARDLVRRITGQVWQWLSTLRPSVILGLGWLLFMLVAYPGVMTMDSFDQLEEGRAWFFTDSHPPAMAAMWGVADRLIPGPIGPLVIQSVTFLAGLYLLLARAMPRRRAAVAAALLLLFPPVLAPLCVIWKDCLMAGFLILGFALVLEQRRWVRVLGLAALCLGTAMRYNAFAATLPLVVLCFEWRPDARWLARYALATGAWLGITLLAFGINTVLTDRKMHFWASTFALADITGTIANVDDNISDDTLRPLLAPTGIKIDHDYQATLRAKFRPETWTQLLAGDTPLWSAPISGLTPAPVAQREAIERAWSEIVTGYPGGYVRYRLRAFAETLGIHSKFEGATVIRRQTQTPERLAALSLASGGSKLQLWSERKMLRLTRSTPLFRPWLYAVVALLLLPLCRRNRDVLALLLSGIAMELTLLALAITPDYRYSHWLVVTTCLGILMLFARRARTPA